ncbi:MAG: antirestriction protein [Nanoarchaeota archaeon]|nr:antirestriction protein [Nanoarchaeota archaeon]MCG2717519.1 antirestriction protein [Nanoarchaeota archaeon]
MNEKVKNVLETILEKFKTGDIPEAIAYSMLPVPDDLPSAKWSLLNRTLMFLSGTHDGRGYKQWNKANRYVKKGSKAFHILVPFFRKVEEEGETSEVLKGFMVKPVFRYEDTDGEALEYEQIDMGELPLIQKAEQWGLNVKAIPGSFSYHGYYSSGRSEIALATKEESVFFHELAHAAHEKVKGKLKGGQDPLQEIVAELSAQALSRIVGKQPNDTLGNSYRYIESYAEKLKIKPYNACMKVLGETEKVLTLILKEGEA